MTAILIISAFFLVFALHSILRTKRLPSKSIAEQVLPPARPVRLFGDASTLDADEKANASQTQLEESRRADALLARAASGESAALLEAHGSRIDGLYPKTLDALVAHAASSGQSVQALASLITASDTLRANTVLAEALLEEWRKAPDAAATTKLLHIAALSDDARMYERAVTSVFEMWRAGRLDGFDGRHLRELFESEYWVLSADAKRSGAGFMLKQRLADVRRALAQDGGEKASP